MEEVAMPWSRTRLFGLVLLGAGLGGCAATEDGAVSTALGHVHDLAMDDDRLLVATHAGLYEVTGGEVRQVGTAQHDLMAFTIGNDGVLLASGHPDLRDDELRAPDRPPLLGLVASGDGGRSWAPRSLLGEADFHALTVVEGEIFGLDGTTGRVLVSDDGIDWDVRGEFVGHDLALDPSDPDTLVGVTYEGDLEISSDGGGQWTPVESPALAAIEWRASELVALGVDGSVHVSERPGGPWTEVGALGDSGEALLVTDQGWFAATEGPAVLRSRDSGRTWDTVVAADRG